MKKTTLLGCLAAWGAMSSPAFAGHAEGSCWPTLGSAHVFNINENNIKPDATPGQKEIPWSSSGLFKGLCYCPDSSTRNSILFRFTSDVLAENNAQRSGDYIYYPLPAKPQNSGINIGFKAQLGGESSPRTVDVDLQNREGVDNGQAHSQDCDDKSYGYDFETGSQGTFSLQFTKKITGKVEYNGTLLTIHAKKNFPGSQYDESAPFVKLNFNLNITVPPKCYINGGQTISVDFGKIASSEFKLEGKGKEKTIDLNVNCDNEEDLKNVSIKFLASDFNEEGFIRTRGEAQEERTDLGIKLQHNAQKIDGNSTAIPLEGNSIKVTATPVQQGKKPPKVGQFNATSTLTFEFK